jgi:hypothetical protein
LAQETLLQAAGSTMVNSERVRLRDLFKNRKGLHPAWGTMIVRGGSKGTFQLADPRV